MPCALFVCTMKIKKIYISGYRKLLISIACIMAIVLMGMRAQKKSIAQSHVASTEQPVCQKVSNQSDNKQSASTSKHRKKRAPASRPTKSKIQEEDLDERKAALECMLYEDNLN